MILFTDGASYNRQGAISVVLDLENRIVVRSKYIGRASSQFSELKAIEFAIDIIKSNLDLASFSSDEKHFIFSDSLYAISVCDGSYKPKKYKSFIASLKNLIQKYNIRFIKVKAHTNVQLNCIADQFAKKSLAEKKEYKVEYNKVCTSEEGLIIT